MSAQTSYSINLGKAYPGLVYAQASADIISRSVQTTAGIGFGRAVSRGTDGENQIIVGGTAFLGITIRALDQEGVANTGAIQWDAKDTAGVLREGYIWAACPTGCAAGNAVNYNTTTGVLDSGAPIAGELAIDKATWETTTAAGELGIIRITGPSTIATVA